MPNMNLLLVDMAVAIVTSTSGTMSCSNLQTSRKTVAEVGELGLWYSVSRCLSCSDNYGEAILGL
uniref:Secreted protein n=1 Tax=Physcomitrium patens TaxID=3218 RepID=A0A2K1KIE4_PHYPA|nr:hypothetical protein PHYPA_007213 [Physcomitrium patens]